MPSPKKPGECGAFVSSRLYPSTDWSCHAKAVEEVDGRMLCRTHAKQARAELYRRRQLMFASETRDHYDYQHELLLKWLQAEGYMTSAEFEVLHRLTLKQLVAIRNMVERERSCAQET